MLYVAIWSNPIINQWKKTITDKLLSFVGRVAGISGRYMDVTWSTLIIFLPGFGFVDCIIRGGFRAIINRILNMLLAGGGKFRPGGEGIAEVIGVGLCACEIAGKGGTCPFCTVAFVGCLLTL